ncbi:MAG: lasso peptide biosynthesis B2 protein [Wenzhouxiangella sp.]|nr:MAG: lasso peptide biosynthesis B2 protein [Wenzhouxiangella sp.]
MRRVPVKLARFFRQPAFVLAWFFPVWVGLGLAKLAIFTVSFKRLVPRLGVSVGLNPWLPLADPGETDRARLICQVVRQAARVTPWDSNCFPQAVVARIMLGFYRIPYCLFFGVRRGVGIGKFEAHAWVASGRVRVTGGSGFSRFTVVGVFVAPDLVREQLGETSSR